MKTAAFVVAGMLIAAPASAQYFLAPTGSDSNDCLNAPCATAQHIVDLCPGICGIHVAPGRYHGKVNVQYYKVIVFSGRGVADDSCPSPYSIVFDDQGVAAPGPLFSGQDHAILTLNCLGLAAYNSGTSGFVARQFAIGDANDIAYFSFPNGIALSANETSKMNAVNSYIYGGANNWGSASDLSQLSVGGVLYAAESFSDAMIAGLFGSIVSFYPSSVTGTTGGPSYKCVGATIKNPSAIPGQGPSPSNLNCQTY